MMFRRLAGVTLIEVMIALGVLAIGVLAVFGLQSSTLQTNRNAQTMNQLTRLATTEMELRRQTLVDPTVDLADPTPTCRTPPPPGMQLEECTVELIPCGLSVAFGNTELDCDNPASFATYRIVVQARARGHSVELESFYGGFYVSGFLSGASGDASGTD